MRGIRDPPGDRRARRGGGRGRVASCVSAWRSIRSGGRRRVSTARSEAETRAKEFLLQAQDEAVRLRTTAEEEHRGRRAEIQRQENDCSRKRRTSTASSRTSTSASGPPAREREIEANERQAESSALSQTQELEQLSGLTMDEAREVIIAEVEQDVRDACARRARELELEAAEMADLWARRIIATAIQRYSSDQVTSR